MLFFFFEIPAVIIAMVLLAGAGFIDANKGLILTLIDLAIGSIFVIAAVYFAMGLYHLFRKESDGEDRFEGIVTAVISAVVMRGWWWIFMR